MSDVTAPVHNHLDAALRRDQPALMCYLPLGDPRLPADAVERYVDAGVDVLEIGVPVPNPYVDGRVVRESMRRSLATGVTPRRAAELAAAVRERHPEQATVWMSYAALVEHDEWIRLGTRAGVDGLLFPESARHFSGLQAQLGDAGIHLCHFVGRELPEGDVAAARAGRGYLMLQAVAAHTGEGDPRRPLPDSTELIATLRREGVAAPVALGIGISTAAQVAQAAAMGADGVIVGSAAVDAGLTGGPELTRFLGELRRALG